MDLEFLDRLLAERITIRGGASDGFLGETVLIGAIHQQGIHRRLSLEAVEVPDRGHARRKQHQTEVITAIHRQLSHQSGIDSRGRR